MINIPNGKWETNVRPYISLLYNSYLCDVTVPSIKYVTQRIKRFDYYYYLACTHPYNRAENERLEL